MHRQQSGQIINTTAVATRKTKVFVPKATQTNFDKVANT